ncbi:MAG TPA: hypothetical protein VJ924_12395, partial [Alphaproteobacteria bacterium]|nr:hypothetical protein [Alphaproteobacteria bacterium]
YAGRLEGFNFAPDIGARDGARSLLAAANKALRRDVGERVRGLAGAADDAFALTLDGFIAWQGHKIARLVASEDPLEPRVEVLPADLLEPPHREAIRRRLSAWLAIHLGHALAPLFALRAAQLKGVARGLAFELSQALGCLPTRVVGDRVATLDAAGRQALAALGVVVGEAALFLPALKDARRIALRALLWSIHVGRHRPPPPPLVSFPRPPEHDDAFLAACLYLPTGPLYVRADRLERLARQACQLARHGPFTGTRRLAETIGVRVEDLAGPLAALGYIAIRGEGGTTFSNKPTRARRRRVRRSVAPNPDSSSPFAALNRLVRK